MTMTINSVPDRVLIRKKYNPTVRSEVKRRRKTNKCIGRCKRVPINNKHELEKVTFKNEYNELKPKHLKYVKRFSLLPQKQGFNVNSIHITSSLVKDIFAHSNKYKNITLATKQNVKEEPLS